MRCAVLSLAFLSGWPFRYAYVGFVDGTFAMIRVDTMDDDRSLVGAWREAGDGLQRITYPVNASTGRQSGGYGGSSAYDPRVRQWYVDQSVFTERCALLNASEKRSQVVTCFLGTFGLTSRTATVGT